MKLVVGCDIGDDTAQWARASRTGSEMSVDATGSLPSVVGTNAEGQLQVVGAGSNGSALANETTGFVTALGSSEPIMVGATPYGAESLLAAVLSAVLAASSGELGAPLDAVAIVHDDDMDAFRTSLLTEAGRLAGVPTEMVVLVGRSAASAAAENGGSDASGGALLALAGLPEDDDGGGGAALAAGATGLAIGGAVGLGAHLADSGVSAAGLTTGPAGAPISGAGPSGTAMGPSGTPLGSAGPAGTPLGTAGPKGDPLGPSGPTGTPFSPSGAEGPSGAPVGGVGPAGVTIPAPKPRPRWIPAAVVGGVVAVVAVVGVVVLAQGDDGSPESAAVAVTTVTADVEAATTVVTDEPAVQPVDATTPVSETTEGGAVEFDTTAFIGEWQGVCEPFLPGDGASAASYRFEPAGPNQLEFTISGIEFPTVECVGEGDTSTYASITQTATLLILGERVVEGRNAYFGDSDFFGEFVIAVEGDSLYLGEGSTFDPSAMATRR